MVMVASENIIVIMMIWVYHDSSEMVNYCRVVAMVYYRSKTFGLYTTCCIFLRLAK